MTKNAEAQGNESFNLEEYKEKNLPHVIEYIKWLLIKEKLFVEHEIKIEENEMDDRIQKFAESRGLNVWQVKKMYSKEEKQNELLDQLREQKLFEILKEKFEIEEVEVD
jgi:FKBP-type peptidyl-prolyl cis-trans isomerase (trigger factor)